MTAPDSLSFVLQRMLLKEMNFPQLTAHCKFR